MECRVDVVVEHVVIDAVVLVEEAAAAQHLLFGRIGRDVPLPPALEHRHVLGLAARSRVGEIVEAPRLDLGDEIARLRQQRPGVAAQIAQVEIERLRHSLVEHGQAAAIGAAVEGDGLEHVHDRALIEFKRIEPHERGGERRVERFDAGKELQLASFFLG